jgi:hypothetical protein
MNSDEFIRNSDAVDCDRAESAALSVTKEQHP